MKYFCPHPWQGLDIDEQGNYRPCCRYEGRSYKTYNDYASSQELADIRQDFLNGGRPKNCDWCWREESSGIESKRQLDSRLIFFKKKLDFNQPKIVHLTFSFGNTCNLACVICNSWSSSRWIKEATKLKKVIPSIPIFSHNKYYKQEEFLNLINLLSEDVIQVEITGGEPFLTGLDEHLLFLNRLKETNPNVILCYTTNGTVLPDEQFWLIWKDFKEVRIRFSIDGLNDHFEYNRWPAKWSVLLDNLKFYQDRKIQYPNLTMCVIHVVSVFTIYYLPEFMEWSLRNKLGMPYLQTLIQPEIFDINVLPKSVKDKIVDKLSKFNLKSMLEHLTSTDASNKFDDTIKMIQTLDQQRNSSFSETFPEFYQLLKEA